MSLDYTKTNYSVGDFLKAEDINQISSALFDAVSAIKEFGKIDKITAAPITPKVPVEGDLIKEYSVTAVKIAPSTVSIIIHGKDLDKYTPDGAEEGHWVGFTVDRPSEDITGYKLAYGSDALKSFTFMAEDHVVSCYVDVKDETKQDIVVRRLQWMKDSEPVSEVVTYNVDVSDVALKEGE